MRGEVGEAVHFCEAGGLEAISDIDLVQVRAVN
jgi:hypothetical protein